MQVFMFQLSTTTIIIDDEDLYLILACIQAAQEEVDAEDS